LFGVLTSPVIVPGYVIRRRSRSAEHGPVPLLLVGIGIAALWSCCPGIVVLQLILKVRDGLT
jgi:hypothetical protein